MKLRFALVPCVLFVVGCAPTPRSPASQTSSAELTSADVDDTKSAMEKWAEKKAATETGSTKSEPREARDPLAMDSALEESSIPSIELTPANQVRGKSPGELTAAVDLVKTANSVDEAAKKLTIRLGKPSWTEAPKASPNAKRRIWIAPGGAQCHRLVLESDGSVEVESVSKSEWFMMTASAHQNRCTGEIKRGISK